MPTEFEFIRNIKEKFGLNRVGDDCAVLPKDSKTDLVITADLLVEDIDFRLEWGTTKLLGHKALAVSLSDVAAMGAIPKWAMLSVGVPEQLWRSDFMDGFYKGCYRMAKKFDVEIVGGDISRTPDKAVIDSVIVGEVPTGEAVMRSGASAGDSIFVTGALGGSAGGLRLLESGKRPGDGTGRIWQTRLLHRHLSPWPQVREGEIVRRCGATAMIDISDGLSSDLTHLCEASGVGARIYRNAIPIEPRLSALQLSDDDRLELAMSAGEDYELLFTARASAFPPNGLPNFHRIGEITAEVGVIEIVDGQSINKLPSAGYRHF